MQQLRDIIEVEARGIGSAFSPLINPIFKRGENQMTAKSVSTLCSLPECQNLGAWNKAVYCWRHYARLRTYGDVNKVLCNRGEGRTPTERYWSRVALTADDQRCWIWHGQRGKKSGYGAVMFEGKVRRAHVVAYRLKNGVYPTQDLLHSCDTPLCVNTNHTRQGTQQENIADKMARNRQAKGERVGSAKLTADAVRLARLLHARGAKFNQLNERFNVSKSVIRNAILGITWRHVT